MDWNKFAEDVHENAKAHGWWDEDRDVYEIVALIHSEWSEALEEYRAGRPMVWYGEDGKPEGIAVELMDGVIRILDYFVHIHYKLNDEIDTDINDFVALTAKYSLPMMIVQLHTNTHVNVMDMLGVAIRDSHMLYDAITDACAWVKSHGIDYKKILMEKHEYNKTRPYKHGGKLC